MALCETAINQNSEIKQQRVAWGMEFPVPAECGVGNAMESPESLRNYMEALGTGGDCWGNGLYKSR